MMMRVIRRSKKIKMMKRKGQEDMIASKRKKSKRRGRLKLKKKSQRKRKKNKWNLRTMMNLHL